MATRRRRRPVVVSGAQTESRRRRRVLLRGRHSAPSNTAVSGRWNPFRTKHLLDSVCEVVTGFSSKLWDEMLGAGWCVKDSKSILGGAGYVLAPWLEKEISNIRELKSRTEGKGTGFWM